MGVILPFVSAGAFEPNDIEAYPPGQGRLAE